MSLAPVLCVFGTASDVGKSWITSGLCRLFSDAGADVAPFKAQNLSNNAGVTPAGLEMGRAQVVQAHACRLVPHVDMNPLLLKPGADGGAQVVALGRADGEAATQAALGGALEPRRALVLAALDRLRARHGLVVAEGAGSCAEVNLRARDLVNFSVAHHADAPVLLVADIHNGGVFAQVVGTLAVLPPADRARVAGVLINRFRGDPAYFTEGITWLEQHTGVPVLGVVPWAHAVQLEREDALPPDVHPDPPPPADPGRFHVAVLRLPHLSNFTDFDALERHGVVLHYLSTPRALDAYDLVVLPGTKNTRWDRAWLRRQGWDPVLRAHRGALLGVCGGYQLLGRTIADPHGVEGPPGTSAGLGLLPVHTVMARTKTTRQVRGLLGEVAVTGYEIHMGETTGASAPLLHVHGADGPRPEGCREGRVWGTYLHGIFDAPGVVAALLGPLRPALPWPAVPSHATWRDQQLDALAAHLRGCLDLQRIGALVGHRLA